MLIDPGDHGIALFLRNRDWHDLVVEATLGDGRGRPTLAFGREFILGLARDAITIGDFLRCRAHLVAAERISHQRHRAVDQCRFAKAPPHLRTRQQVWLDRHVLVAPGDDDLGLTGAQLLDGAVDRLQPGAAKTIDIECGRFLRQARLQGRTPRVEATFAHLADAAQDAFAATVWADARALHRGADRVRAQVRRGRGLEGTRKFANGGADAPRNDDPLSVARHEMILIRRRTGSTAASTHAGDPLGLGNAALDLR